MTEPEAAPRRSLWYWVRHHVGWSVALLVLLTALAAALFRAALPALDFFRGDLEQWASKELDIPVTVDGIGAEWRGWRPVLRLDGVRLMDAADRPFLRLDALLVEIDPAETLRERSLQPDHLIARGADITVERAADGGLRVCCLDGDQAGPAPDLRAWLLGESMVEIDDATVHYRDQVLGGITYTVNGISAVLVNHADSNWLRGRATLPAELGADLTFAIDLTPGPAAGMEQAEIYLEASGLRLDAVPFGGRLPEVVSVGGGTMDGRLWLDWHGGRIARAHLETTVRDLALAVNGHALPTAAFAATAALHREDGGQWRVDGLLAGLPGRTLVTGGQRIDVELDGDAGTVSRVALATGRLDLRAARPYINALVHGSDGAEAIDNMALSGDIDDLQLAFEPAAVLESMELRAQLGGIRFSRHGAIPGIAGLDARIAMAGERIHAVVDSPLEVDATHLFRQVLEADQLSGALWVFPEAEHWTVRLDDMVLRNSDIRLLTRGVIQIPNAGGAPYLNLVGEFDESRLDAVRKYLPAAVMADDAVRWIDRGLVSGRIHRGGVVIQGRTDRFPWEDGSGRLEARAQLEQGIIEYQTGWPRLEEIEAEAVFVGRSMAINGYSAKILGSDISNVSAASPNLDADDVLLRIDGKVSGPGQDGMRILLETPLRRRFEDHLGGATVGGAISLDLGLQILLDSGDVTLDGDVHFKRNDLTFPLLNVPLAGTTGTLHITDHGLSGTGLRGTLDGIPVGLEVKSISAGKHDLTRVQLSGPLNPGILARRGIPWSNHAVGTTTWQAAVDIPNDIVAGPPTRLSATTDLAGLALHLPAPLGKAAGDSRPLTLGANLDSADGRRRLRMSLGDDVHGVIDLVSRNDRVELEQADIRIGAGPFTPIKTGGLYIRGDLPRLDADRWVPLAVAVTGDGDGDPSTGPRLDFAGLNVSTRVLTALGQDFKDARVVVHGPQRNVLRVDVDATGLAGSFQIPLGSANEPMNVDLDRLYITLDGDSDDGGDSADIDPRDIPSVNIDCADCRLGELALGEVSLTARSKVDGIAIHRLVTNGEELKMDASGEWVRDAGNQSRSLIKTQLKTDDLGRFLKRLGYQESGIIDGRAKARLEATWAGPPTRFSLARSTGELEITIKDGRLEDVDPGAAGRVFGLLSINALPRRLFLDFRDLFKKGLSFDTIEGSFTIDNGDAYTNNLTMNSPSAQVDVAGRVGLATEDYDEIVTVTPKVSSTLPLAGAIAGGPVGAAVGAAAAFISKNIMGKEVGGAIKTQYAVTGPWKSPEIVKLGREGEESSGGDKESVEVEQEKIF